MKLIRLKLASAAAALTLTSCSGLLMTPDFGSDYYGPTNDWYWSPYNGYYNGLGGYLGPSWNTPPPPPPPSRPLPPSASGNWHPNRPNGANRPNYIPDNKPSTDQHNNKPATAPNGAQRPGNMGQGSVKGNDDGGLNRGR